MNIRWVVGAVVIGGLVVLGGCRAATSRTYDPCIYSSDCASSYDRCVTLAATGRQICSPQCVPGGAACPPGGTCSPSSAGVSYCAPGGGGGTVPSYGPCSADGNCATPGDRCLTVVDRTTGGSERICSSRCSAGTTCPTSAIGAGSCVSFDGGGSFNCYQTCSSSAGCGANRNCAVETGGGFTTQICLPGSLPTAVPAYAGCAMGMTCVAGTTCTGVKNGTRTLALCTRINCASDADCPRDRRGGNGLCARLDGDSFNTCIERCILTNDCTYGSMGAETCTTRTLGGATLPVRACLPT